MKGKNEELKAGVWFAICNVIQKGAMLISVPIFTRLMSVEEYGITTVYQSWNNILTVVVTLSLSLGVFNNGMLHYKGDRSAYISAMQGLSTVSAIIFSIVSFLLRKPLSMVMGLPEPVIVLMFVSYIFIPAFEYWSARNRYEYKYKGLLAATIIYTVLYTAVPIMAVTWGSTGVNAGSRKITASLIVWILFALCFYIYNFAKGKNFYIKEYWKYAFWFNLPLLPHYLSNIVLNQSDRIMIAKYCGESQAGIYSKACYLQTGVSLVVSAVNSTFVPWLYERMEKKEYSLIQKRAEILLLLLGTVTFAIISCAPEFIGIMAPGEYSEAVRCVPPVMIGTYLTVLYMFFGNIEIYCGKRIFMTVATVSAATANVLLNYIFIPHFGYVVCAYTTVFCYFLYAAAHYFFMNRISTSDGKIGSLRLYDIKRIICIYLAVVLLGSLQAALYQRVLVRYAILGLGILLVGLFRRMKR